MQCDIIVPVWNQLDFTKGCIEAVFQNTIYPFHLIVVDNASDDPTKNYLDKLAKDKKDRVTLLKNEKNLGFIKATNQGIKVSSAPYLCLLNNDTKVTTGWLTEMIKVAEARDNIGIVNANSNTLGATPKKGESLETFAGRLKSYTGRYSELAWATGFCMLIKRQVAERVGPFDEIYGMGNFEDADFSKRAQNFGYFCVCAIAAYVYHRERRSFIKHRRFDQNFQRNRQIFYSKWGKQERILYVLTKDDPEHIERVSQRSLELARAAHIVWIFFKDQDGQGLDAHSNIYVYNLPRVLFNLISFWRILKRKKKFDKIYVDDENYARRLDNLKPFHKAEVIYEPRPS